MNKVVKSVNSKGEVSYVLTTDDGQKFDCTRWYEKKTDAWHVKLPKDNPSGRTYIRESNFDNSDVYTFETKTNHRTGLVGGGWRSKLTPDEAKQLEKAEATIDKIKKAASARTIEKVDPNSAEGLQLAIARLTAKLEAKKAQNAQKAQKA